MAAPTLNHGIHGQVRSAGMTTQGLPTLDPQLRDSGTVSLCCSVHWAWQSNVETAPGSDQLYEGHTGPSKLSHGRAGHEPGEDATGRLSTQPQQSGRVPAGLALASLCSCLRSSPAPVHRVSPLSSAFWGPPLHGSRPCRCHRLGCTFLKPRNGPASGSQLSPSQTQATEANWPRSPRRAAGCCCGPRSQLHSCARSGQAGRPLWWKLPFLQVLPNFLREGLNVLLDTREAKSLGVE